MARASGTSHRKVTSCRQDGRGQGLTPRQRPDMGFHRFIEAILDGAGREEIRELWRPGLEEFLKRRQTYLLYPRP